MITTVRELDGRGRGRDVQGWQRARLVIGVPLKRIQRTGVATDCVFGAHTVVAYRLRLNERERLFVFRTLPQTGVESTHVPGVHPRVQLLLCAHTGRRIHRALRILTGAKARGHDLAELSDAFFLRAATTLASRAPIDSIVTTLLRQEP